MSSTSAVAVEPLSAVEQFARERDRGSLAAPGRVYSRLLPATAPGPGQQFGFHVDLDRCSGCKACVTACHSLNGLDDGEIWRDVGLLVGGTSELPVLQHVTSACHHCLDPACLSACPVDAYEKDPATGIVRHFDDQCIGCRYCLFACPYDAPKFNRSKGIVRKCDMCSDRLAAGEAPACVAACPQEAISIQIVDARQVVEDSELNLFLPNAPEPHRTYPATVYEASRPFPRNTRPADYHVIHPEDAHWPLVTMLVLTQLSVGAFLAALLFEPAADASAYAAVRALNSVGALGFGFLALAISVLHLGRPRYAYRAILGLRHSWLSREIAAFGLFALLASIYALGNLTLQPAASGALRGLGWGVASAGIAGVLCSVFVYAVTGRSLWNGPATSVRFFLTTVLLGIVILFSSLVGAAVLGRSAAARELIFLRGTDLCTALMGVAAAKLGFEGLIFRHLRSRTSTFLKRSARLMAGPLANAALARYGAGILGGLCMPAFLLGNLRESAPLGDLQLVLMAALMFVACLIGEFLERYLFFAAATAPRMPGSN